MKKRKKQTSGFKIALYIRASTDEQGSSKNPEGTIKNQEQRLRKTVEAKQQLSKFGEIIDTFIDDGISAKNTKRPELQRLFQAIKNEEVNMVMVTEYSRLSRNMRDFAQMWEMFKTQGCGLISLREQFDTSTAAGEMMLYNMANLAQFERRLTSERVSSSRNDRASRGLYNGGVVPLGYKTNPNKPGYLEIDEESGKIVKMAFEAFQQEGSLSRAAKWLNSNGYKPKKEILGGGKVLRVGQFTVGNLQSILSNKTYTGVVTYTSENEIKETKALWPKLINKTTFHRVQKQLKKNYRKKKPHSENRYPYTLTGVVFCKECGDHLCGKSAHGRNGKTGYYEHSWSVRKNSTLTEKAFECGMLKRVPAKLLQPMVHELVEKLFSCEKIQRDILKTAKKDFQEQHSIDATSKALKREKSSYNAQSEALAIRLAKLPEDVPADSIYEQFKKLKQKSDDVDKKLNELKKINGVGAEKPIQLKDYKAYLQALKLIWINSQDNPDILTKVIQKLISKVEVGTEQVIIHYIVGRNKIKRESSDSLFKNFQSIGNSAFSNFFASSCGSNTLQDGAPTRTRTTDTRIFSPLCYLFILFECLIYRFCINLFLYLLKLHKCSNVKMWIFLEITKMKNVY